MSIKSIVRVLTWIDIVLTKISSMHVKYIHRTKFYTTSVSRLVGPAVLLSDEGLRGWYDHTILFLHSTSFCEFATSLLVFLSITHSSKSSLQPSDRSTFSEFWGDEILRNTDREVRRFERAYQLFVDSSGLLNFDNIRACSKNLAVVRVLGFILAVFSFLARRTKRGVHRR